MVSPEEVRLPRSLLSCLPLLWQHTLFPGIVPEPGQRTPWHWVLLLVLPALILYPSMGFPLFDPDEGRYAEIPREMLERGEWIVPTLLQEPYLDKPPLFYWLVILSYRLFGVSESAARLVPALATHGTLLVTYLLGRRLLGARAALVGTLLLGLAPAFGAMSRLLLLDGLLTFWTMGAFYCLHRALSGDRLNGRWWIAAALVCGLGVLTKGPVILLLIAVPTWLHRRLGTCHGRVSAWAILGFLALVLAVSSPWYLAVCLARPEFARHFLLQHNLLRFLSPFDHLEPIWFYGPVVLLGLLPGTLVLPSLLRYLLSEDSLEAAQRPQALGHVLLMGGWCLFFFTLSGSKLATYVLPAFPPLCLSLGFFVAVRGWDRLRWVRGLAIAGFVLLIIGHHIAIPWFAWQRAPLGRTQDVLTLCTGDVPIYCFPRHCDSVAFALRRDDLKSFRSKEVHLLTAELRRHPRAVVLCTHRHTRIALREALPKDMVFTMVAHQGLNLGWLEKWKGWFGETALGLADVVVVEQQGTGVQVSDASLGHPQGDEVLAEENSVIP